MKKEGEREEKKEEKKRGEKKSNNRWGFFLAAQWQNKGYSASTRVASGGVVVHVGIAEVTLSQWPACPVVPRSFCPIILVILVSTAPATSTFPLPLSVGLALHRPAPVSPPRLRHPFDLPGGHSWQI